MKELIKNLFLRTSKRIFEARRPQRSPLWRAVETEHKEKHPTCAACAAIEKIHVHHKVPFHVDSSLELDPDNLITLCMSSGRECHFYVGHGGNWKFYNPDVEKDSAVLLSEPQRRRDVLLEIKSKRID